MVDTAGSQSINSKGTGTIVEIPAVYDPDATCSVTAVQQILC